MARGPQGPPLAAAARASRLSRPRIQVRRVQDESLIYYASCDGRPGRAPAPRQSGLSAPSPKCRRGCRSSTASHRLLEVAALRSPALLPARSRLAARAAALPQVATRTQEEELQAVPLHARQRSKSRHSPLQGWHKAGMLRARRGLIPCQHVPVIRHRGLRAATRALFFFQHPAQRSTRGTGDLLPDRRPAGRRAPEDVSACSINRRAGKSERVASATATSSRMLEAFGHRSVARRSTRPTAVPNTAQPTSASCGPATLRNHRQPAIGTTDGEGTSRRERGAAWSA